MTNDQQQIEAWISDFWELVESSPDSIKNSEYNQIRLEGFLIAKRSMQPIELPTPEDMYDPGGTWLGRFWADGYVHNSITAAGYSYRVK